MTTVKDRAEIDEQYKWNAESVFPTRADWNAAFASVREDLGQLTPYQGRLAEGPQVLADFLELMDDIMQRMGRLRAYTSLASNVDTHDQEANAMAGRITGLAAQAYGILGFMQPELLAIGQETLDDWLDSEPRLHHMRHYIDALFRKQEHVRTGAVEQLLGMLQDPFRATYAVYEMLANTDLTFEDAVGADGETVEVTQSTIRQVLQSPDREMRRTGYMHYTDGFLRFRHTFAANYIAAVKQAAFRMRARGHESTLAAALFGQNVPEEVFHSLIETFKANLPVWHRYWRIRREALGVDELHWYDQWAPLTGDPPQVPYEEAVEWIASGMAPLGDHYVSTLRRGTLEDRWVDVYPNRGKRLGAFSSGAPGTYPFIMMSYGDTMQAMSTLAHELGHSLHSYLAWENQPAIYAHYSMFAAEVASNFNQAMTRAWLLENRPDLRLAVIEEAMYNFHRYFFIMPTLARFEYEVHGRVMAGDSPNADELIALMADLFAEGFGDELAFDRERTGITWATFQHLYVPFYTFQYATRSSAAHALSRRVLAGGPDAAADYLAFLKAGGSMYPVDALQMAGVDMRTPDPVETTFGIMASYVDELAG
ncbi:MAG: oligoendopeptidase F [Anaerolineae bacterium]